MTATPLGRERVAARRHGWLALAIALVSRAILSTLLALLLCSLVPAVLGWHPTVVATGSMEPRLHPGDVVVSKPVAPREIRIGQIVLAHDPDHPGRLRMHRVAALDGHGMLTLRGDANEANDSTPVARSAVLGVASLRVPRIGVPLIWSSEHDYLRLVLLVLALAGLVYGACALDDGPDDDDLGTPAQRRPRRPRRRPVRPRPLRSLTAVMVVLVLCGGSALTAPHAQAAPFSDVTTSAATTLSANDFFTCRNAVGGAYAAYPLDEAAGSSQALDSTGDGHTGHYLSQGLVPTGTTTYQVPGPCSRDGGYAASFAGGAGVVAADPYATPDDQTTEIWFRSTSTTGGLLIGSFVSGVGDGSGGGRLLYLGSDGRLRYGLFDPRIATTRTLVSPSAYNDGAWHLAVGVLSSTGGTSLYVDGALVASDPTSTAGADFVGYTRIANGTLQAYPGGAASSFTGALAFGAIYRRALTADEVSAQYTAAGGRSPDDVDVATNRPADASSIAFFGWPGYADDGNTDGNFGDDSVSHTDFEQAPWWQVDTGGVGRIDAIAIWNRTDCCADRLSDFWVFTSAAPLDTSLTPGQQAGVSGVWAIHVTRPPSPSTTITLPPGVVGRYVMVQLGSPNYLSLAEVQVYGPPRS